MKHRKEPVNGSAAPGIAPLRNVALFHELVERMINRPAHLPGLGCFYGFSGLGKSFSATYGANCFQAHYVEAGSTWTRKKLCERILQELGVAQPRGTVADLADEVIQALSLSGHPLIIDEFDHLVARGSVELIREIHDKSGAAIILIGEEQLPRKLAVFERFHNRVLDWVPAQPADLDDMGHLARLYAPGVTFARDLLERIVAESKGQVRRIAVNIEKAREKAATSGLKSIALSDWGSERFFTGSAPMRDGGFPLGRSA